MLEREVVADVTVEESSLGIGLKKLLVMGRRHTKVAIALAGVKLNIEAA